MLDCFEQKTALGVVDVDRRRSIFSARWLVAALGGGLNCVGWPVVRSFAGFIGGLLPAVHAMVGLL